MLLSLACIGSALAGTTVVHAGDVENAVNRVAADSGTAVWELRPVAARELWTGDQARVMGHAQPAGCAGSAATNAGVRELVGKAEKRLLQQEYADMRNLLGSATQQLACLSEPAEASLAARLFFLDGYAAAQLDDKDGAAAGFERAQNFQPGLAWDEKLPPDGKPFFDAAAVEAGKRPVVPLYVGPGVTAATLWVDGRLATVTDGRTDLSAGRHLVQVLQPAVTTYTVQLVSGRPVVIAVPAWLADKAMSMVADPAQQPMVQAAIEQALGVDQVAFFWTGSRSWRFSGKWEGLTPNDTASRAQRRQLAGMLRVGGLTAAVVGGAAAGVGWVQVLSRVQASPEENEASGSEQVVLTEQRTGALEALQPWAWAGTGVAIAGVAATVAGFVLEGSRGPTVAMAPYGDGAWVGLTW